jgi:hypothetical protein
MGLDMYFYLEKYEAQLRFSDNSNVLLHYDEDLKELENDIFTRNFKSIETKYQVGYFRKFNALHSYIVNKYANGEDDCKPIFLDKEDIEEIIETLKSITKDNAKKVLPTQSGFFFGSQEYDEWYFKDIEYAIDMLEKMLKVLKKSNSKTSWSAYYQASW